MEKAILKLLKMNIKSRNDLMMAKRRIAKKYDLGLLPNSDILTEYQQLVAQKKIKRSPQLEEILRKRSIRTLSGIAPVAVLTRPYPCPGRCAYCPTEKNVPQSYLSNEPAVMRAIRCNYNPYQQVRDRLHALIINGHQPTKIELIVIGGTWSVLPEKYKYWFITNLFAAANRFKINNKKVNSKINQNLKLNELKNILQKEQKRNEKAKYKIIGLTLETRPDYINKKEINQMRELGATRVEIGVQAIDDNILNLNRRGHGVAEIAAATKLLKDYGFKVTYHIMPGLPGSTPARDFKMFQQLFTDERFQPDQIKFYPTVVTRGSLLYKWWRARKYKPYSQARLNNLIIKCKQVVPPYVRIIRLIRDIPEESIIAGNRITNLRQIMKERGVKCRCIRCREAKESQFNYRETKLKTRQYQASDGEEYFLSYESKDEEILYGFCRLRLPAKNGESTTGKEKNKLTSVLKDAALIRELHIYGRLTPIGNKGQVQHLGLGKKLMAKAEKIARQKGYRKMVVIAGVGVRDYYRSLGYHLQNTYMIKKIN
jgi:elongator complex protein 3